MKLRQTIRSFKPPKLGDDFALKTTQNWPLNGQKSCMDEANALATSTESKEDLQQNNSTTKTTVGEPLERNLAKPRSSLGFVEMQSDEMGPRQLGSLCFRKSLPETVYSENMYTSCHLVGGKLRKRYRGTDGVLLVSGHHKSKELLVRCESIMIYPKVLLSQDEHNDKIATNSQQHLERYKVNEYHQEHQPQSETYKVVSSHHHRHQQQKFEKHKNDNNFHQHEHKMPKQAWNQDGSKLSTEIRTETDYRQLPRFSSKFQAFQQEIKPNTQSKRQPGEIAVVDSGNNQDRQTSTKNSASTKIIVPFGEAELVNKTAERHLSTKECAGAEMVMTRIPREILTSKKDARTLQKEKGAEKFEKAVGKSNENSSDECIPVPIKLRYLKESSKLNEKSSARNFNTHVRQVEVSRQEAINTQYVTVNLPNFSVRRFRIPTGVENDKLLHVGQNNYPPKTKSDPYLFAHSQRGASECGNKYGVDMTDHNGKENTALKIGGKSFLKASAGKGTRVREKIHAEEANKKKVQFSVHNSQYIT